MAAQPAATWKPPARSDQQSGHLDAGERNEPLNSASHVRNAIARFDH